MDDVTTTIRPARNPAAEGDLDATGPTAGAAPRPAAGALAEGPAGRPVPPLEAGPGGETEPPAIEQPDIEQPEVQPAAVRTRGRAGNGSTGAGRRRVLGRCTTWILAIARRLVALGSGHGAATRRRPLALVVGLDAEPELLAWQTRFLSEAGFDSRQVRWQARPARAPREELLLGLDARSVRRARNRLDGSDPEALGRLESDLGSTPQLRDRAVLLAAAIERRDVDYLHAVGASAGNMALALHRALEVPYGLVIGPAELTSAMAGAGLLDEAALVVADCAGSARAILAAVDERIAHLTIMPPPVYPGAAAPAELRDPPLRIGVAPPVAAAVIDDIADAVRQVADGDNDVEVEVIGDAVAAIRLSARLARHRLEDLAPAEDGYERGLLDLDDLDVLVVAPSRGADTPDLGLSPYVPAAMAAGIPIIGQRGTALEGIVRDGEEGVLLAPGDRRGLARALARLATDAALRLEIGRRAQRRFRTALAPEAAGGGLRARLHELLRRPL